MDPNSANAPQPAAQPGAQPAPQPAVQPGASQPVPQSGVPQPAAQPGVTYVAAPQPAAPFVAAPQNLQVAKPLTAMGVTSLVLGILALLTSFLPIINNGSFFLALLGVIFSIVGLVGCSRGKRHGMGLAVAGLVLGIVSIVVVLGTQSIYSAALDEAMSSSSSSARTASASA